jgi:hypothetical protein
MHPIIVTYHAISYTVPFAQSEAEYPWHTSYITTEDLVGYPGIVCVGDCCTAE